jgi:hypothetical protein
MPGPGAPGLDPQLCQLHVRRIGVEADEMTPGTGRRDRSRPRSQEGIEDRVGLVCVELHQPSHLLLVRADVTAGTRIRGTYLVAAHLWWTARPRTAAARIPRRAA